MKDFDVEKQNLKPLISTLQRFRRKSELCKE
jgi:hypothetical protein